MFFKLDQFIKQLFLFHLLSTVFLLFYLQDVRKRKAALYFIEDWFFTCHLKFIEIITF